MNQKAFLGYLILLIAIGFLLYSTYPVSVKSDFALYLAALQDAILGKNIYLIHYGSSMFTYPLSVLLFILPFTLLPFDIASLLWTFLNIGLFLWILILFFQHFLPEASAISRSIFISLFLFSFPVRQTIDLGQINLIVLFFSLIPFFIYVQKPHTNFWKVIAGLYLGIAGALKIIPLFIILFFLRQKKYLTVVTIILTFFVLNLAVILIGINPNLSINYILSVPDLLFPTTVSWITDTMLHQYDQSLIALLKRYTSFASTIQFIVVCITTSTITWYVLQENKQKINVQINAWKNYAKLLTIATFFPVTLAWQHHLIFVYPLLLYVLYLFFKTKKLKDAYLFLGLYVLLTLDPFSTFALLDFFRISNFIVEGIINYHGLLAGTIMLILL